MKDKRVLLSFFAIYSIPCILKKDFEVENLNLFKVLKYDHETDHVMTNDDKWRKSTEFVYLLKSIDNISDNENNELAEDFAELFGTIDDHEEAAEISIKFLMTLLERRILPFEAEGVEVSNLTATTNTK